MKIGILETGTTPKALVGRHGTYPDMIAKLLRAADPEFEFTTYAVQAGEVPEGVDACAAYILTGSPHGVYDALDWIPKLEAFIRAGAAAGVPQTGICFGHQIMTQAFGGRVEKSQKGWGVGLHTYEVVSHQPWMTPPRERVLIPVSHQDQVVAPPEGAARIAASNFCEYGILAYANGPAISFQNHPEFTPAFAADLIRRRDDAIPETIAETGLKSLEAANDRDHLGRWIATFLRRASTD